MTTLEITKEFNLEMLRFLEQFKSNVKTFVSIPTLENVITFLDGYCYGLVGQLIKKADEEEYIVYKSPDMLVKEELIRQCLIPETKRQNTINPNYTMIMFYKNKYADINQRIEEFITLAMKCYAYEIAN
jgi:hypothetical protein